MALLPNTQAILNAIQSYLQSSGVYTIVEQGAVKDWTGQAPLAEVMFIEDDSEHYAHGGKIRDTQGFRVTSVISFTSQTPPQAVAQLITIRDTIIPTFQQHAYLGGVSGVMDSRVKPKSAKISWMLVNGDDYVVHEFIVEVRQTYNVPIGTQGI
jgi:hypothetical protein